VSRFSIPAEPGREDVARDPELPGEAPDQLAGIGADGDELGDRPAALGDHKAFGADAIEDRQTLLLELGGRDRLHGFTYHLVSSDG
jgi:hypothetical protein